MVGLRHSITETVGECIEAMRWRLQQFPEGSVDVDEKLYNKNEYAYEMRIDPVRPNTCSLEIGISSRGGDGTGEFDVGVCGDMFVSEIALDKQLLLSIFDAVSQGRVVKFEVWRDGCIVGGYGLIKNGGISGDDVRLHLVPSGSVFKRLKGWLLHHEMQSREVKFESWVRRIER